MIVYVIQEHKYFQLRPKYKDTKKVISWDVLNAISPLFLGFLMNPAAFEFLERTGSVNWSELEAYAQNQIINDEDLISLKKYGYYEGSELIDDILLGLGLEEDEIIPEGGLPDPLDPWLEVFVKGNFETVEELNNYISTNSSAYAGQICSVTGENKVYLVINDENSGSLALREIGSSESGGQTGGAPLFEEDIVVSIGEEKTFGKYKNGDIIPAKNKNANEVIKMACFEVLEPDISISTNSTVLFGSTNVQINLNFSYVINTLGANIAELKIERKRNSDSNWTLILNNPAAASPFLDSFSQTQHDTSLINYRYTVADSAGGTKTISYNVEPASYLQPTISSASVGTTTRYRGDSSVNYTGTITKRSNLVPISSYKLQRSIDSGSWADVGSVVSVTSDPSTISVGLNEADASNSSVKNANNIRYRIAVTDSFRDSSNPVFLGEITISFLHKNLLMYSTSSSLSLSNVESASGFTLLDSKTRTINGVTASGGNYTYYVYKSSLGDLSNVIQNDSLPVLGAFSKQSDIIGTNPNGASVSYSVYRSNSTNAFTNAKLAFS
jgi:hypothetical protein